MNGLLPLHEGISVIEQVVKRVTPENKNIFHRLTRSQLARRCGTIAVSAATAIGLLAAPTKAALEDIGDLHQFARQMAGENPKETNYNRVLPGAIDIIDSANKHIGLPVFALDGLSNGKATVLINRCLNPIMLKHAGVTNVRRRGIFDRMVGDQATIITTALPAANIQNSCDPTAIHPEETATLPAFKGK